MNSRNAPDYSNDKMNGQEKALEVYLPVSMSSTYAESSEIISETFDWLASNESNFTFVVVMNYISAL